LYLRWFLTFKEFEMSHKENIRRATIWREIQVNALKERLSFLESKEQLTDNEKLEITVIKEIFKEFAK
jgi:hypothetical protein